MSVDDLYRVPQVDGSTSPGSRGRLAGRVDPATPPAHGASRPKPITLAVVVNDAAALLDELFAFWRSQSSPSAPETTDPGAFYAPAVPRVVRTTPAAHLGAELGERLVREILNGVRAGRQGVFVSDPERLRTAIFIRGYSLGDFARLAGIAPSTLSRALAGQPVAPQSWRALIFTLDRT